MKKGFTKILTLFTVSISLLFCLSAAANAALTGDIAGDDKKVTASDARIILRASVGLESLTDEEKSVADTNEDGKITASDARDVLRMSVGLDEVRHYYTKTVIKPSTCSDPGRYLRTCTECDDKYEEDGTLLPHTYPTPEVLIDVTCETDGLVQYVCKVCGEAKEEVIKAGHVWDGTATCTEGSTCIRGGHKGEPLGHTTDWGKCTRCKVFITEKYEEAAAVIKEEIPHAIKKSEEGYAKINESIGAAGWLKKYASEAKPMYEEAKASYQAAYDACAEIPEFASIKANLKKALSNTDKILKQIDVILATSKVTDSNYLDLTGKIDTPQWANDTLNSKLTKAIIW